jgi:cell division transport system permease protein
MFREYLMFWLRETFSNIARNRLMSLLAVTTVTFGLVILGACFVVISNMRAIAEQETGKLDIVVFLKKDISEKRRKEIYAAARIPQVADLQFVSRSQALREMQTDLPDLPVGDLKDENPLNDELRIKLKKESVNDVVKVQSYLDSIAGVVKTRRDNTIAEQLIAINRFLTIAGVLSLLLLGLMILLIIHNAIRLTIFARRREIRIMELVGATSWFIRIPFLLEGVLYGILGAVVAALILGPMLLAASRLNVPVMQLLMPQKPTRVLSECISLMMIAGLFFGLSGSWFSLSRSLGKAAHL